MHFGDQQANRITLAIETITFIIYILLMTKLFCKYGRFIKGVNLHSFITWAFVGVYMISYKAYSNLKKPTESSGFQFDSFLYDFMYYKVAFIPFNIIILKMKLLEFHVNPKNLTTE